MITRYIVRLYISKNIMWVERVSNYTMACSNLFRYPVSRNPAIPNVLVHVNNNL